MSTLIKDQQSRAATWKNSMKIKEINQDTRWTIVSEDGNTYQRCNDHNWTKLNLYDDQFVACGVSGVPTEEEEEALEQACSRYLEELDKKPIFISVTINIANKVVRTINANLISEIHPGWGGPLKDGYNSCVYLGSLTGMFTKETEEEILEKIDHAYS